MLSLKSASTSQVVTSWANIPDLPHELLKSMLDHIYSLDDLLSASLVSKWLRDAVPPIVYRSINVTFTTKIKRNGETILDFLSKKPHLRKHVREVVLREVPLRYEARELEFLKFHQLSTRLENLRELRICISEDLALRVLALPFVQKEAIRMSLVVPNYKQQHYLQRLRDDQAIALTFQFSHRRYVGSGDLRLIQPAELGTTLGRFYALRSLSIVVEPEECIAKIPLAQSGLVILEADSILPALQELHLEFPEKYYRAMDEATNMFLAIIPWARLQRLSLAGMSLIEEVLQAVGNHLISLSSLHLKTMTLWSVLPRRRRSIQDLLYRNPGELFVSKKAVVGASLFLESHPLEELILEGFGMDLPLSRMLHPRLRKLELHICELLPTLRMKVPQAADLQTVARRSLYIEHLELDIGQITNLWHSTAVPGVDFDVRVYQVLDKTTTLPRLKRLRLFPQYREVGSTWSESIFIQPLTDDTAVRLFRRLKEKSSSLETLAISSDNHVARCLGNFDPMSWELCAVGEKIQLTVRQANRDYEQRQVWIGERRLTTEIRRFSYKKSYIPEFEGWTMEC